jgi:hypothetical protein
MNKIKLPRKIPVGDIVVDRGLVADTQRVFAKGRQLVGEIDFDEEKAVALARRIQGQLAELSPDTRLANRKELVSFLDDLRNLIDRLEIEKSKVEKRLVERSRQRVAEKAYGYGSGK